MKQATKKTDTQIHHDVLEELKWDSRVDETEVGVQVARGVVTLTGTVTSWAKRVAAQEAARRVIGVLDVANDIKVKVPGGLARTDTEIAQAVRQALEWDVFVPDEQDHVDGHGRLGHARRRRGPLESARRCGAGGSESDGV